MPYHIDIANIRFGRLIALQAIGANKHGEMRWLCQCDCGKKHVAVAYKLRSGNTVTCGCRQEGGGGYQHGYARKRKAHPLYRTWITIRQRCNNPNATGYEWYGAVGIKVCKRWNKFPNFLADVRARPPGYLLDRIDVNGPYAPNNIRWVTPSESTKNRRPIRTRLEQFTTDELKAELLRRRRKDNYDRSGNS